MPTAESHQSNNLTLHLPRILCLHGGGTNARIFRMQCRVIERDLRPFFRLVFAEAPFPAKPGPDVTSVYQDYGPFKSWLRMVDGEPCRAPEMILSEIDMAIEKARLADDGVGATGELVAVLGFSQGAKIAASLLYRQQMSRDGSAKRSIPRQEFKFGVLLAGRGPIVWMQTESPAPDGFTDAAQLSTIDTISSASTKWKQPLLTIPTTHVHGLNDPGLELHRRLLHFYCDKASAVLLEWDGNHRVPIKTQDVNAVVNAIFSMAWKTDVL